MKREVDIAVISDVHLGNPACYAQELLNYLNSIQTNMLILNGDFLDANEVKKGAIPAQHLEVIQTVIEMASNGTRVYYVAGNHDDFIRKHINFSSGNIQFRNKLILKLKGKTIWIFHGDILDLSLKYSPLIAKFGGKSYDLLLSINRLVNQVRDWLNLPRMSFAKKIKQSTIRGKVYSKEFEDSVMKLAANQGYDYVICGHTHLPHMRVNTVNGKKVTYLNSGDWVEHLTALEYKWGRWSIYDHEASNYEETNALLDFMKNQKVPPVTKVQQPMGLNMPGELINLLKNKVYYRLRN